MDSDARIRQLEEQLAQVDAKRKALHEFMDAARAQDGDLFSWVVHRELNQDFPGADLGLTMNLDGEVGFHTD